MKPIVLASTSPYRRELLQKLQIDFEICGSNIDETPHAHESPEALAIRLSIEKAKAVAIHYPHHFVIASDQVAMSGKTRLGKPGNSEAAIRQLNAQSGKIVSFYTGLCVLDSETGNLATDLDLCKVHFKPLSPQQIQRYVELDQPFDCAGSFKSESLGIALFSRIEGDDPNALIGLPLIKLIALLDKFGIAIP